MSEGLGSEEIGVRQRRAAAVERMRRMVAEGEIDFSVIEISKVMEDAGTDARVTPAFPDVRPSPRT
ncbi:hypothetical protein [Streptomyces flaveus]|uniref:hypothetical protein n=1 Tax=Streptomyces flaveus TaxID=66370 RepID=UPI00166FBE0F|nr:hypothetical protein [Streptomyces flaveus]